MSDEKQLTRQQSSKPSLWNQALKAVKGDNTSELVEQFTQEMTLVAEGLCEDQARLRRAVDGLIRQAESRNEKADQDYDELERKLDALQKDQKQQLGEIRSRLSALEAQMKKPRRQSLFSPDVLGRVTVMISIVCGTWLLVTVLKLFL